MWISVNVKIELDNFWSENDSIFSDVKLNVFKRNHNEYSRLEQNLTTEEADFIHFMRLRNQLADAAEHFKWVHNLSVLQILTMSEGLDEQLKPPHKIVDVVVRANRKILVTLLR